MPSWPMHRCTGQRISCSVYSSAIRSSTARMRIMLASSRTATSCSKRLPQRQLLHALDVEVARVSQRVRDLAGVEGGREVAYGVLYRVLGFEAQVTPDALRRDVVGAVVVGRGGDDAHVLANHRAHRVGDLAHGVVVVAGVIDLAVDLFVRPLQ